MPDAAHAERGNEKIHKNIMIKVRSDEPKYAFLWDKETKTKNRYGKDIELAEQGSELRDTSLNINADSGIGENPNRYKQH